MLCDAEIEQTGPFGAERITVQKGAVGQQGEKEQQQGPAVDQEKEKDRNRQKGERLSAVWHTVVSRRCNGQQQKQKAQIGQLHDDSSRSWSSDAVRCRNSSRVSRVPSRSSIAEVERRCGSERDCSSLLRRSALSGAPVSRASKRSARVKPLDFWTSSHPMPGAAEGFQQNAFLHALHSEQALGGRGGLAPFHPSDSGNIDLSEPGVPAQRAAQKIADAKSRLIRIGQQNQAGGARQMTQGLQHLLILEDAEAARFQNHPIDDRGKANSIVPPLDDDGAAHLQHGSPRRASIERTTAVSSSTRSSQEALFRVVSASQRISQTRCTRLASSPLESRRALAAFHAKR